MSDIELRNVCSDSAPLMRSLSKQDFEGEYVDTDFGPVFVVKAGVPPNSGKPYIITYHDLGLNFASNFQAFFNFFDMKILLQSFTVLNIHAPGQEENAAPLADGYIFPTMDQLAQQVDTVCKFYGVVNFVGFGIGAGANVLSRYALDFPEMVDGLFLIHPTSTQSSWTEWIYQKMNIYYMNGLGAIGSSASFPQSVQDYLMWHHFGAVNEERSRDLIELYRRHFSGKNHNIRNLAMFIDSYIKRTDLGIERSGNKDRGLKCTTLLVCGSLSPHVDDTVNMNGRCDPSHCSWMKISDCGMVLEEQPQKVVESLKLFLQGLGYALSAYERRRSIRTQSQSEDEQLIDMAAHQQVHIVENPMLTSRIRMSS